MGLKPRVLPGPVGVDWVGYLPVRVGFCQSVEQAEQVARAAEGRLEARGLARARVLPGKTMLPVKLALRAKPALQGRVEFRVKAGAPVKRGKAVLRRRPAQPGPLPEARAREGRQGRAVKRVQVGVTRIFPLRSDRRRVKS